MTELIISAKASRVAGSIAPTLRPATGDEQRTYLAWQRTLLAWVRTSLALMGFGFLVAKFGLFLREVVALRANQSPGAAQVLIPQTNLSLWIGMALVLLGLLVNIFATREHIRYVHAFAGTELSSQGRFVPQLIMLFALCILGAALAVYLLLVGR